MNLKQSDEVVNQLLSAIVDDVIAAVPSTIKELAAIDDDTGVSREELIEHLTNKHTAALTTSRPGLSVDVVRPTIIKLVSKALDLYVDLVRRDVDRLLAARGGQS